MVKGFLEVMGIIFTGLVIKGIIDEVTSEND